MKVHEIMTAHARCVGPDNTLVEAAGLMRELDVGALPICDEDRLAGMVTDRDLVLRGVANGRDPNTTPVRDVMSAGIMYAFADQDVEEVVRIMEEKQIRRLPILSREKRLVGIVSLGDIATSSNPAFSGTALRDVSMPAAPTARQRRLQQGALGTSRRPQQSARVERAGRAEKSSGSRRRKTTARTRRGGQPRGGSSGRGRTRGRATATQRKTSTRRRRSPARSRR